MARFNLERMMLKAGIKSINELSKRTGISRPTLTNWKENKVNSFNLSLAEKVADVLDCEITELITLDE